MCVRKCACTYPDFVALFTAVSMLMPTLNAKYTAGISLLRGHYIRSVFITCFSDRTLIIVKPIKYRRRLLINSEHKVIKTLLQCTYVRNASSITGVQ